MNNFDPNPLFYDMVRIFKENYSPENKVTICNEGSSRCFDPSTKVVTESGLVEISDIKRGDSVLTFNEDNNLKEFKPVEEVLEFKNVKPAYKITLKNGDVIKATQDHEFYYKGAWCSLKHIVSLYNESKDIDKRKTDREVL